MTRARSDTPPVVIVGAGVTGLVLAWELKRAGIPVRVFEESGRAGGSIDTEHAGDYLLEWGPHTLLADDESFRVIRDLGLEDEIVRPAESSRKRYVACRGEDHRLLPCEVPGSIGGFLRFRYLSPAAKLKILLEPFRRRTATDDTTVEEMFRRRLGVEITDSLIAAALTGVYAGDLSKMSMRSTLPRIWGWEAEHGSLLLGMLRSSSKKRRSLISLRGGLGTLVRTLERELAGELSLGRKVRHVVGAPTGARVTDDGGSTTSASFVCLTVPALRTSALLAEQFPDEARELRTVPYAPVGVLHLSARASAVSHPLDGFGVLIPPRERSAVRGALFISSLFPGRAPDGRALITCFVGGAVRPEMANVTEEDPQQTAVDEISSLLGCSDRPTVVGARTIPFAIPNPAPGHYRIVDRIAEVEKIEPRIRWMGSWRDGVGVPDRLRSAVAMARFIGESFGSGPS